MKFKFDIKEFFTGKRKNENFVLMIVLLIVVVVAINYIWNPKRSNKNMNLYKNDGNSINKNQVIQVNAENEEDDLEKKLERILAKISGARKGESSYYIFSEQFYRTNL